MAKTPVMIRLTDDELARLDHRAAGMRRSRASVVLLAVQAYLDAPSLLDAPMIPLETDRPARGPLPPLPPEKLRGITDDLGPPVPPTTEYKSIISTLQPAEHPPGCVCKRCMNAARK